MGRRKVYGDITQNASPEDLEKLLRFFDNHVPTVIAALVDKVQTKGSKTYIPPAFYERNGAFVQVRGILSELMEVITVLSTFRGIIPLNLL